MIRTPERCKEIVIDLMGEQGNAYWLLGYARNFGKQLGLEQDKIQQIRDEMTESNYNHLVAVFDFYFGEIITLEASDELMREITPEIEKLKSAQRDKTVLTDWIDKRI